MKACIKILRVRYVVQGILKNSSVEDRQSLGIAASSTNNASGNKSVTCSPEYRYYESNKWYVLSENKK